MNELEERTLRRLRYCSVWCPLRLRRRLFCDASEELSAAENFAVPEPRNVSVVSAGELFDVLGGLWAAHFSGPTFPEAKGATLVASGAATLARHPRLSGCDFDASEADGTFAATFARAGIDFVPWKRASSFLDQL